MSSRYTVPDIRLPINIGLLHYMWNIVPIILRDQYLVKMYRIMLTLAYHGLLRPGEITYTPHAIKVEHTFLCIKMYTFTCIHQKPTTALPPKRGCGSQPRICSVANLHIYLQVQPCIQGALFHKENGLPVHYHELLNLMDKLANFLDLPTDRFKPHSLRIGATTDLHLKGYTPEVIKKRGRWSLAAFQRYIHV